ncbi:MAG: hypothetical protein OEU68_04450 [Nitrospira sp.]|nr:hypothetical protein [Nitrospira sp.]MDH4243956.1 hypothetical protein [Nitrospira sp.]MDH4356697.1 hypothetical protein [Nitrospira sp.]MDH5317036.1 hypothetical protein [Nitrospira sp.]
MGSTHFQETEQRLWGDELVLLVPTAPECWGGAVLKETVPVCSFPHAEACSFVAFGGIPVIVSYPMKAEG